MPLPIIDQPLFELALPSSGKKVKYRAFTVKEEKILLIAQESKEIDQIVLAIKQVVSNCVPGFDVEKAASFDMEYLLMNIRAKAVNNEFRFNVVDPETKETVELTVDISEIQIQKNKEHSPIIDVTESVKLKMSYPTFDLVKDLMSQDEKSKAESLMKMIVTCIETVVDGENVYKLSDFNDKEVATFIESLGGDVLQKIKKFFDTVPVLRVEKKYKNSKGEEKTFVAAGTETFFI